MVLRDLDDLNMGLTNEAGVQWKFMGYHGMYTTNNMGWDVRNGYKFTQESQFHPCHTCPVLSEKFCDLFVEMVTNCPVVETSGEQFTLNNPDKATVYVMLQLNYTCLHPMNLAAIRKLV